MFLHGLGGVVIGFETLRHLRRHLGHRRQFGMHEVIDVLKTARFTEKEVFHTSLQLDVLHAPEPDQLTLMGTVKEGSTEPLRLTDTDSVPFGHFADDLHIGIFVVKFGNAVETTPVDILIGILTNEIEGGIDPELFTKNVGTLSTDILTIRYISMR